MTWAEEFVSNNPMVSHAEASAGATSRCRRTAHETTCVAPCPLSSTAAHTLLQEQDAISERLLSQASNQPQLGPVGVGEINQRHRSTRVLRWLVASRATADLDILEIGASLGVGSTQVMAETMQALIARNASPASRRLLSLEVVPAKFVHGQRMARQRRWPSELRLASTVPPSALPATSGNRPQARLA
jgi:hypothetical protein